MVLVGCSRSSVRVHAVARWRGSEVHPAQQFPVQPGSLPDSPPVVEPSGHLAATSHVEGSLAKAKGSVTPALPVVPKVSRDTNFSVVADAPDVTNGQAAENPPATIVLPTSPKVPAEVKLPGVNLPPGVNTVGRVNRPSRVNGPPNMSEPTPGKVSAPGNVPPPGIVSTPGTVATLSKGPAPATVSTAGTVSTPGKVPAPGIVSTPMNVPPPKNASAGANVAAPIRLATLASAPVVTPSPGGNEIPIGLVIGETTGPAPVTDPIATKIPAGGQPVVRTDDNVSLPVSLAGINDQLSINGNFASRRKGTAVTPIPASNGSRPDSTVQPTKTPAGEKRMTDPASESDPEGPTPQIVTSNVTELESTTDAPPVAAAGALDSKKIADQPANEPETKATNGATVTAGPGRHFEIKKIAAKFVTHGDVTTSSATRDLVGGTTPLNIKRSDDIRTDNPLPLAPPTPAITVGVIHAAPVAPVPASGVTVAKSSAAKSVAHHKAENQIPSNTAPITQQPVSQVAPERIPTVPRPGVAVDTQQPLTTPIIASFGAAAVPTETVVAGTAPIVSPAAHRSASSPRAEQAEQPGPAPSVSTMSDIKPHVIDLQSDPMQTTGYSQRPDLSGVVAAGVTVPPEPRPDAIPASSVAPPATPIDQIQPALVRILNSSDGVQSVTVRLQPPELGQVQIRVERNADGTAHINVTTERPDTLQLLQSDQPRLEQALDQAGVAAGGRNISFQVMSPDPVGVAASPNGRMTFGSNDAGQGQNGGMWRQNEDRRRDPGSGPGPDRAAYRAPDGFVPVSI